MATPEFYPPELWNHSPVYNTYAKLFIKDIHALRHLPNEGIINIHPTTPAPSPSNKCLESGSTRFWLNHPIRWVQVIGVVVALTPKEKNDIIIRLSSFCIFRFFGGVDADLGVGGIVDDSSGETIELVITQEEHRSMMPDPEFDDLQERLWKRRRKE